MAAMQHEPALWARVQMGGVKVVADHRETECCEGDANLVQEPGFETDIKERVIVVALDDFPREPASPSSRRIRLNTDHPGGSVLSDLEPKLDFPLRVGLTFNDGVIVLGHAMLGKSLAKLFPA